MVDITDFNGVTLDTEQIITGQKTFTKDIIGQADVIAYSTGEHDITLPIASTGALGTIKIGEGLNISEDGTVSVSGGSGTVSEWGDIGGTLSNQTDLWEELNKKAEIKYYIRNEGLFYFVVITFQLSFYWPLCICIILI